MRLPAPLSRPNPKVCKNNFGHVLVVAGSPSMLGAAALTGLAAMRSGAGLVTLAVPSALNLTLQKKISPVLMTLPLPQTNNQAFALKALASLKKIWNKYDAVAIGPGMGQGKGTQKFILDFISHCPSPMVIDADALNALAKVLRPLLKNPVPKTLTPHPCEMARLTGKTIKAVESDRKGVALDFAKKYRCILVLKGHRTVVASPEGKCYVNQTGNAGMATAGSGDVLTGMIAAILGQGIETFEAAKLGVYLHGKAGDLAAKSKSKTAMIATDIIDSLGRVF